MSPDATLYLILVSPAIAVPLSAAIACALRIREEKIELKKTKAREVKNRLLCKDPSLRVRTIKR